MPLITKFDKGIRFLLCANDIFSKYAWVVPLNDKKCKTIVNAFQKILDNSTKLHSMIKPNKISVDKDNELCNSSFKKWLKDNDIEMHSSHSKEKSVVVESLTRPLKNQIYKPMTAVSKKRVY